VPCVPGHHHNESYFYLPTEINSKLIKAGEKMSNISFSSALRAEYEKLFNTCIIQGKYSQTVDDLVAKLLANKIRYQSVSDSAGIPWYFIAVIHNMEASLNFKKHLHNGDPLTSRTVQVPANRPKNGTPPFTWEESASDALALKGLSSSTDWSLAGLLYQLERYNGFGYRSYHPWVLSPYLWSFSTHYKSGKYVEDGTWSDSAISKQCGAAVLLRRMAEKGQIEFSDQPVAKPNAAPLVVGYSMTKSSDTATILRAEELQRWLNTFPGVFVKVDGVPGKNTSDAYKTVVGTYLPGDPRGT
jgi:lysozyme family protein